MTYELNRLGSLKFEELIQSLVKGIEPTVIILGKGPDGQREFICRNAHFEVLNGKYALGYTVGQAKFKDPDGKEKDWDWLRKNLKAELEGFRSKKVSDSSKIPDSYLFFTNIVLTPKEGSGLRDKAEEFINEYRDLIPTILIFGADDIRTMLENNRDVAQAYNEFILPGDVLARMIPPKDNDIIKRGLLCDVLKKRMVKIRQVMDWSADRYKGHQGYVPDYFTQMDAEFEVRTGSKKKRGYDNLLKCINKYNKGNTVFLVSGRPGSGKSTALIKLWDEMLDKARKSGRIPIYINLKGCKGEWTYDNVPSVKDLKVFVKNELMGYVDDNDIIRNYIRIHFDSMYDRGVFYFIFDSFDEIPCLMGSHEGNISDRLIDKISSTVYDFFTDVKQGGGVVASREFRGPSGDLRANVILEIQEFDVEHIKKTFENNRENKDGYIVLSSRWIDELFGNERLVSLCRNPFYLTLLIDYCKSVDINEGLPRNQMSLYTSFFDNQIRPYPDKLKNKDDILDTAKKLAVLMHESQVDGLEYSCDKLYQQVGDKDIIHDYLEFLDKIRICRLDEKEENITFVHRRFYEFFLAKSMQDAEINMEGEIRFDYDEITKSNSEIRDAMVLYCEIAPIETATKIAKYCWQQLKDNIQYKNSLDGKGSIVLVNTLYFMIDAFRNRKDAIVDFEKDYEKLILDNCEKNTHFIVQLAFVSGTALFDKNGNNLPQLVLRTFEMKNLWLDDAIVESCWLIEKVDDRIETEFTDYFHSQSPRDFIKHFPSLQFTLSKSKGLKYVKCMHYLHYIWLRLIFLGGLLGILNSIITIKINSVSIWGFSTSSISESESILSLIYIIFAMRVMDIIFAMRMKRRKMYIVNKKYAYFINDLVVLIGLAAINYDLIDQLLIKWAMIASVCWTTIYILLELPWIVHDLFYGITRICRLQYMLIIMKKYIKEIKKCMLTIIKRVFNVKNCVLTIVFIVISITAIAIYLRFGAWEIFAFFIFAFFIFSLFVLIAACLIIIRDIWLRHKDAKTIKGFSFPKRITRVELANNLDDLSTVEYKLKYINRLLEKGSSIDGEWPSSKLEEGCRRKFNDDELEHAMAILEYKSLPLERRL